MRIFIGFDQRQPIAYTVCRSSIERHASGRVQIERLELKNMPIKRVGLTQFTFSRYMVPYLCGYEGQAIFMDGDILLRGDVYELAKLADRSCAVSVVKNPALRFEWPSVMVFENSLCKSLTPEFVEKGEPQKLGWAKDIGTLPSEWNHLIGYDRPRKDAKLCHFTQGLPCFPETKDSEYEKEWVNELMMATGTVSWAEIMGGSVHAKPVMDRLKSSKAA